MTVAKWEERAAAKKRHQQESLPKQWILADLPDKNQLDVSEFPRTCGLLTSREVEITESHINIILANLASRIWTAVEVTTAFSKRAIIAHQLVSLIHVLSRLVDTATLG